MNQKTIKRKLALFLLNRFTLIILLYTISLSIAAHIITVKQDSTGNFIHIQTAIDACQNGDTILVYPGTYYENINFHGKSITLGSLNLITNDPIYINQTVIDGNHIESCLKVVSGETVEITGFKITHGSGDTEFSDRGDGGGIFTYGSTLTVKNCLITGNNASFSGGGIYLAVTSLYLSGTTICNNHAKKAGGGLVAGNISSQLIMDSINRCNIYLNFAGEGCDIYNPNSLIPLEIIVDTFTVLNPDRYHIETIDDNSMPDTNYIFHALHAKIDTAATDLYVNPLGNDTNSGLTPEEPLKTLCVALAKIVTNSEYNRKIYLANGLYAKYSNGENLPINIRSYVDIIGENEDSTIFDADSVTYYFEGNRGINHYKIKNLTLLNGYGDEIWDYSSGIVLLFNNSATIENITARNGRAAFSGCLYIWDCNNIVLSNFNAYDHTGGFGTFQMYNSHISNLPYTKDTIYLLNCRIKHTMPSPLGEQHGNGGGIRIGGNELQKDTVMTVYIVGTEIVENKAVATGQLYAITGIVLEGGGVAAYLVNSTVANNSPVTSSNTCAISNYLNTHLYVYNSIIYGNWPPQLLLGSYSSSDTSELKIYHSLIEDGEGGITVLSPWNELYYDPSNLDANPLWDTASIYPYSLSESSPCIDAGTLDLLPGIELPQYDIAGNPRVWGESVDMGAYEYGPWVTVPKAPSVGSQQSAVGSIIRVSPNPFSYGTYISYELQEKGRLNISAYSLLGRKVKTLIKSQGLPSESGKFYWDGRDESGSKLPSASYLLRMTVDDKLVETVKVVKQ